MRQLNGSYYGVCSTSSSVATKTVSIPGFALVEGAAVYVKFANTNSANPGTLELNVNGTGAKRIVKAGLNELNDSADIMAGSICEFVYDGTSWVWVGHLNTDQLYFFADGYNGTTNKGATEKTVTDAIDALDVTDTAVSGEYVSQVSETNGKISVSRIALSPSISITAGNGTDAPKVNITVGGVSGTAQAITKASTSVYGVTKLSSSTSSTSTSLAATPAAVKAAYDLAASKTDNTGTVTNIETGNGLTGGPISTTGTISHAVPNGATASTLGSTTARYYIKTITTDEFGHITAITTGNETVTNVDDTKLPLAGGTMTGAIHLVGGQSSAYNDKGLIFTEGSRIGENSSGGLGIYAAERVYIRPSSTSASSGDGIEVSTDGLYPSNNNTETLGDSSHKWKNVYATTFTGSLDGTAKNATNATKADAFSSNKSITLTGDVTGTAASTAGWSIATTLADVSTTATTSTAAPAHSGTFTVIDSVTVDTKGRVTGVNTKTVTLPADNDTKYYAGAGLILNGTTFNIGTSSVTNAMLAGSIANEKLANSSIDIAGNNVSLGGTLTAATLRTSLGLSSAIHFLGKATVSITDGSTVDPKIGGNTTTVIAGDVVIDSNSAYEYIWDGAKWERLGPDGSYVISGSTISVPVQGTVTNHTYQPAGTVSAPTFTGTAATISMSGNTTGVAVGNHSYTPTGSISATTVSTGSNYTPSGSVSQPTYTGNQQTVYVNGTPQGGVVISSASNANGNYTPEGTIQAIGFTGTTATISVSGTPTGSVTISSATVSTGANYTPEGTNAASSVTITPSTTSIYSITNVGSKSDGTTASFTQGSDSFTANKPTVIDTSKFNGGSYSHSGFSGGTSAAMSMTVTNEVLSFSFTPNGLATYGTDSFTGASFQTGFYTAGTTATFTQGTDSFTPNKVTTITLPTRASATVWNGYTAATAAAQTFSGQGAKLSASFSGTAFTSTGKYQPAGTVSTPAFQGTRVELSAAFTGTSTTFSGSFKSTGTVSQPVFTGDPAKFTFSGSAATLTHTVTQGSVSLSTPYTPAGTVSAPTFTGTTATLTHVFNGTTATVTLP